MSKTISDYTAAVAINASTDYLLIQQSSAYKKINRNVLLGIAGFPVGDSDSQTITNKTLDNTTTLTVKDGSLTIQNSAATTKQAVFSASGITAGQTRTFTFPDASGTLATIAGTQTLTNKTITSPTISGGSLDNTTVTVDAIGEHTAANGVTIDGLNIKDGALNTSSSVPTSALQASAVTAAKINFGGGGTGVWWEEIGRTTLGASGNTISVTGLSARTYLRILVSIVATGGTASTQIRFNNDTANNYSLRRSINGAADSTTTSTNVFNDSSVLQVPQFIIAEVVNITAQEKYGSVIYGNTAAAGAATAPTRMEGFSKWANTASQISRVDAVNLSGTGNFAAGSEVIVLGHN